MFQRGLLEQFTGPSDIAVERYVNMTKSDDQKKLCQSLVSDVVVVIQLFSLKSRIEGGSDSVDK